MVNERAWWTNVSSARNFIDKIVDGMANKKKCVIITLPKTMPWQDSFDMILQERLSDALDKSYREIHLSECKSENDFRELMLDKFCKREYRNDYRYQIHVGTFIGQNQEATLHDNFVEVFDVDAKALPWLVQFVAKYMEAAKKNSRNGGNHAAFLLKLSDAVAVPPNKYIMHVDYKRSISPYAKNAFYAIIADEAGCSYHMCEYLVELLGQCCEDDVELGLCCANEYAAFLSDAYGTLQRISASLVGQAERKPQADAFSVEHAVFAAQLKVVFPWLEEFRLNFVRKYDRKIRESGILEQMGVDEPMDIELGHYSHYRNILQIPESLRERLAIYRDYRNKLAHLQALPFRDVEYIVQSKNSV